MDLSNYYEKYWTRETDVSDGDCTTPERKRRLLSVLAAHTKPGDPILDLGCGGGQFTALMHEAGYAAVGIDLSSKAIEMARRNYPQIPQIKQIFRTLNADGSIPAPNKSFAAVWNTEVIEHVLDVKAFLDEINRVLIPNGLLILTTPYHGFLKNLIIVLLKFDRHFNPEGSHIRFFDKKGLERCLNNSGFTPISWSGIGRFWKMYRTWFVVARKSQE